MDSDQSATAFVERYYATFDANRGGLARLYQEESMLTFEGQKGHVCSAGFYERKSDSFDSLATGYPYNLDFDYGALAQLQHFSINNLGDPFIESNYGVHSRQFEVGGLDWFARLWEIEKDEYWGYITNCGTEGNLHGILVGREVFPDGILYASRETHYSVFKAPLAKPPGRCYAIRSNQGESSGSGGRAGEERNGGGRDGNQGIGGGVGGGGQREGIGNERRGNRGRNHGGGNGDDDGNDRGGWVGYIEGERRPMGPRPHRMAEILLLLDAEIIGTLESLDIRGLSARARILRVFSLGFTSVSLVCLSASIGQRRTNPILASIFSWIGSAATFLGFFLMIAMAFSASFP